MENHHLWIFPLNVVIFHSYVKLQEGKSHQIPLNHQFVPWFSHGFPMVFPFLPDHPAPEAWLHKAHPRSAPATLGPLVPCSVRSMRLDSRKVVGIQTLVIILPLLEFLRVHINTDIYYVYVCVYMYIYTYMCVYIYIIYIYIRIKLCFHTGMPFPNTGKMAQKLW